MITREQVADLRVGDVVELAFQSGSTIRGPLVTCRLMGGLDIADAGWTIRQRDGEPGYGLSHDVRSLTVISRAKPPLYVNSDKTEPDPGDVVRDADDDDSTAVWLYTDPADRNGEHWARPNHGGGWWCVRDDLPDRLRLLVDGRTGQTVQ